MGFDENYSRMLNNTAKNTTITHEKQWKYPELKNFNQKMRVCVSYQSFLYNTLKKVLNKLNQKGVNSVERVFVGNFCALAYFRIPEFRSSLLDCLSKNLDIQITEWRGAEYNLTFDESFEHEDQKNKQLVSLFDWENEFYVYLKV